MPTTNVPEWQISMGSFPLTSRLVLQDACEQPEKRQPFFFGCLQRGWGAVVLQTRSQRCGSQGAEAILSG
ncbi:MAG: hypothetical protein ACK56G_09070 [Pirellulaceae bacterium]